MENAEKKDAGSNDLGAFTQAEFCAAYGVNRVTFHRMEKAGTAPTTIRVGRKVLITRRAAREWEERMAGGVAKTKVTNEADAPKAADEAAPAKKRRKATKADTGAIA
ncbi:hypothetical protein [Paraburkholderia ferrariae]|uniref:Helix-turn-helix domain-containing protein n=1 Tax=Paraburkholderia ferrariae TaxID=386056 RepID=A0ABU9RIF2_9BURK